MLGLWAGACGDDPVAPPEPPNRPPAVAAAIPAAAVQAGETLTVELSTHFSDPDGDPLSFAAAISDTTVATASVAGSAVTVAAVAAGEATITATATDPGGLSASQSFAATVTAAPIGRILVSPGTVTLTAIGDTARLAADAFRLSGEVVTNASSPGRPATPQSPRSTVRAATLTTLAAADSDPHHHGVRQPRSDDTPPALEARLTYRSSAVTNTPPRPSATAWYAAS